MFLQSLIYIDIYIGKVSYRTLEQYSRIQSMKLALLYLQTFATTNLLYDSELSLPKLSS